MAHSRIMAETSRRMWDLSDFLINTTGVPQPLSSALDERHADHEGIRAALHARDQAAARAEMEHHIVGTVTVIHAEARSSIGLAAAHSARNRATASSLRMLARPCPF